MVRKLLILRGSLSVIMLLLATQIFYNAIPRDTLGNGHFEAQNGTILVDYKLEVGEGADNADHTILPKQAEKVAAAIINFVSQVSVQ